MNLVLNTFVGREPLCNNRNRPTPPPPQTHHIGILLFYPPFSQFFSSSFFTTFHSKFSYWNRVESKPMRHLDCLFYSQKLFPTFPRSLVVTRRNGFVIFCCDKIVGGVCIIYYFVSSTTEGTAFFITWIKDIGLFPLVFHSSSQITINEWVGAIARFN